MYADMHRMRMPMCYTELNGCEIEYDGGLSTGVWIGIAIAAALIIGGITMYAIGANMQPVAVTEWVETLEMQGGMEYVCCKPVTRMVASQTSVTVENIGLGMFTAGYLVGAGTGLVATW